MEKQVEELNKKLLQLIEKKVYPIGLAQGQMGICIYFYHLSDIEQDGKYRAIAEQLLYETLKKLSQDAPISVGCGLAGIALGITYLIKAGFVKGEVNDLLEDIDNAIFKRIVFPHDYISQEKGELLHLLFYLSIRLSSQTNEDGQYIFQEQIITTLNNFVTGLTGNFFNEGYSFSVYHYHTPLFLSLCARLLKQDFYNERIYKILDEFELNILSTFPILHTNRLYLLCGLLPLIPYMQNPQWKDYANLLHKEINLLLILEREIKNKHIFISNGLSMVYLLFYYLEKKYPVYKIDYNPHEFYNRIVSSEAWGTLLNDYFFDIHNGLLNGFPGVLLVLSHIQRQNI
jgi:hypothetical protein